jgi:hypothetical protein
LAVFDLYILNRYLTIPHCLRVSECLPPFIRKPPLDFLRLWAQHASAAPLRKNSSTYMARLELNQLF